MYQGERRLWVERTAARPLVVRSAHRAARPRALVSPAAALPSGHMSAVAHAAAFGVVARAASSLRAGTAPDLRRL